MQTALKKEIAIDMMLFVATIGATFIFGLVTLPHVQMVPTLPF